MGTYERRWLILKTICNQRHETIANLAAKSGVSERTIRRDIEILSLSEPIYTVPGRYNGGVYVVDGYHIYKNYFDSLQKEVMEKLIQMAKNKEVCLLSNSEMSVLEGIIVAYTKPCAK